MTMNGGTSLRVEAVIGRLNTVRVEAGPLVTAGLSSMNGVLLFGSFFL
jgi:hypothetical protein